MISPETITLVKERTDLVALVGESVRLQRRGRSFVGLCPFHKEKTGSFHVTPERGMFHCFGCKETGSAVDFVMKTLGMTFPEALRYLAERAGIEIVENTTPAERREAEAKRRDKEDLYGVNNLAALFFERALREPADGGHPLSHHARAELARRGLVPGPAEEGAALDPVETTLQAFRVGYAPFGWDALARYLRQQGVSLQAAEKVGLVFSNSRGGYTDRFRHRLMFAVVDVMGRVVAFSGRALPDPSPAEVEEHQIAGPAPSAAGEPPAKYINSPESPIYAKGEHLFGLYQAKSRVRQESEAWLVEGNFDVVSLHARGLQNVIAPLGTAFTLAQAKLLKRFSPAVTLLFDPDSAGRKATHAARGPCREAGLIAKVAVLPAGMDPDEFVKQKGPEALARLVKGARGLLEHLLDQTLEPQGFGGASLSEQTERVKAALKLLGEEDDPNMRAMAKLYADRLASKLTLFGRSAEDLRQLERIVEQALGGSAHAPERAPVRPEHARSRSQEGEIDLAILGVLLDFPELLLDDEVEEALTVVSGTAVLGINALRQNWDGAKGLYSDEFLAQIPPSIHSFAAGRLAAPVFEAPGEARAELLYNARKLKGLRLLRENAAMVEELQRGGAAGDVASEEALLRNVMRRARERRGLE